MLTIKVIPITFALLLSSQSQTPKAVYVESWKCGKRIVKEQRLRIKLTSEQPTYKTKIRDVSGKERYELVIRHDPVQGYSPESWTVLLYEQPKRLGFVQLSKRYNLLQPHKPGDIGDEIRAEDAPGWLFRWEDLSLPKDFRGYLPFLAPRIIRVENFYCIIQVTDYQVNAKNPKLFDSLAVKIEFTNKYDPSWQIAAR